MGSSLLVQRGDVIARIFSDTPPITLFKKFWARSVEVQHIFDAPVIVTAVRGDEEWNGSTGFIE
jgi:hypothetical protein